MSFHHYINLFYKICIHTESESLAADRLHQPPCKSLFHVVWWHNFSERFSHHQLFFKKKFKILQLDNFLLPVVVCFVQMNLALVSLWEVVLQSYSMKFISLNKVLMTLTYNYSNRHFCCIQTIVLMCTETLVAL